MCRPPGSSISLYGFLPARGCVRHHTISRYYPHINGIHSPPTFLGHDACSLRGDDANRALSSTRPCFSTTGARGHLPWDRFSTTDVVGTHGHIYSPTHTSPTIRHDTLWMSYRRLHICTYAVDCQGTSYQCSYLPVLWVFLRKS
mgnify:CR=1 FL=1